MSSGRPDDSYYRDIEEEFSRRRGAAILLSPRDWALIGEWQSAGVPLRVVLQAIHNVFDAFDTRAPSGRRINSLSYCRQEVQALDELYRTLHSVEAGRPPDAPGGKEVTAASRHLGRLGRRLRVAMAGASAASRDSLVATLAITAAEIKALRQGVKDGSLEVHRLEERLGALEAGLTSAARGAIPADILIDLTRKAEKEMASVGGRMTAAARETTLRAHLSRLIREAAGIPRLTLFD